MAGLLGHLSLEDRELIEAGVHPVIDSNWRVRENMTRARSLERLMKNDEKRFKDRIKKEKKLGIVNKNCHSVPPKKIYDVLHEAEASGIDLPKEVEEWWEYETMREELGNEKPM